MDNHCRLYNFKDSYHKYLRDEFVQNGFVWFCSFFFWVRQASWREHRSLPLTLMAHKECRGKWTLSISMIKLPLPLLKFECPLYWVQVVYLKRELEGDKNYCESGLALYVMKYMNYLHLQNESYAAFI